MLKKLFNECTFTLTIIPVDPILIKSGYATVMGADMTPVVTQKNGQTHVFLPGSSLKGVFRSHAERVARTIKDGIVCIPYLDQKDTKNYPDVFCGNKFRLRRRFGAALTNEAVYRDSCPVCRLFGSTEFIGRIAISDAYLTNPDDQRIERRDGVGIDRFTGGAAHGAKFELEVVTNGAFKTSVHLRNFEIWQLGMVAAILQDFDDELIRIGSGKSRGLGKVKGKVEDFTLAFLPPSIDMPEQEIWGLGKFLESSEYGTFGENDTLRLKTSLKREKKGLRLLLPLKDTELNEVLGGAIDMFSAKIAEWDVPQTMTLDYLNSKERERP